MTNDSSTNTYLRSTQILGSIETLRQELHSALQDMSGLPATQVLESGQLVQLEYSSMVGDWITFSIESILTKNDKIGYYSHSMTKNRQDYRRRMIVDVDVRGDNCHNIAIEIISNIFIEQNIHILKSKNLNPIMATDLINIDDELNGVYYKRRFFQIYFDVIMINEYNILSIDSVVDSVKYNQ